MTVSFLHRHVSNLYRDINSSDDFYYVSLLAFDIEFYVGRSSPFTIENGRRKMRSQGQRAHARNVQRPSRLADRPFVNSDVTQWRNGSGTNSPGGAVVVIVPRRCAKRRDVARILTANERLFFIDTVELSSSTVRLAVLISCCDILSVTN